MRSFREIAEKAGDTAVFTFGRFNPPTIGHEKLVNAVAKQQSKNAGSKMYVYASKSNDPQKNPLPYAKKIAYMRKMFKKYSRNIITGKPRTAIEVAVELYDKGHKAIVMVVGSDRVDEFDRILNEYNGVEGKRHGYYGFDNIEVISAGERDPDAEGIEGMSASKMRAAAEKGDFNSFKTGIPDTMSDADKKKMYFDVRKAQGIREEREMGNDYDSLRDAYLTGKIWNVGETVESKGLTGEVVRKGTNYLSFMTEDGKVHKAWLHEIELDERTLTDTEKKTKEHNVKKLKKHKDSFTKTYGKDGESVMYAVATRDAKKEKKYKSEEVELGELRIHPDKSPEKDIRSQIKYHEKMRDYYSGNARAKREQNKEIKWLKDILKKRGFGEEVVLDEIWWDNLKAKISQIRHPKGWDLMVKRWADGMKDKKHRDHPQAWAQDVAREFRGADARQLIKYINTLVSKGKLPKELKAEYTREDWSFKDFVNQLNNK